jgi:hypothetical protein
MASACTDEILHFVHLFSFVSKAVLEVHEVQQLNRFKGGARSARSAATQRNRIKRHDDGKVLHSSAKHGTRQTYRRKTAHNAAQVPIPLLTSAHLHNFQQPEQPRRVSRLPQPRNNRRWSEITAIWS